MCKNHASPSSGHQLIRWPKCVLRSGRLCRTSRPTFFREMWLIVHAHHYHFPSRENIIQGYKFISTATPWCKGVFHVFSPDPSLVEPRAVSHQSLIQHTTQLKLCVYTYNALGHKIIPWPPWQLWWASWVYSGHQCSSYPSAASQTCPPSMSPRPSPTLASAPRSAQGDPSPVARRQQ